MSGFKYTTEQVEAWLQHIGLPKDFRPDHSAGKDLEALARIQKYHLSKVPFENLELHYTKHHSITLDPQEMYKRVVERGLGGYCMTHQVIIATLAGGHRYLVDVAYGGDCPVSPLKLEVGPTYQNIAQRNRLVQEALGQDKAQKTWIYQIQYAPDGDWHGAFCFIETEFLPQDFGVLNYFTSTNSFSWLATTVMGVKFTHEGEEIVGKYTLANAIIRRNLRGKIEVMIDCQNEDERVDALKKYFGIELNDEEKQAIRGWVAELKSA